MAWRHPGFSAHFGEPISADDTQAIENLAGYVVRNPLSQRLVYLDGQQGVIYKGLKHNPTLGRNFETITCRKCGAELKIVAYLHDTVAIKQILDHLGLSPPQATVTRGGRTLRAAPCRSGTRRGMLRAGALLITLGDAR
jgi:hypothetical protein